MDEDRRTNLVIAFAGLVPTVLFGIASPVILFFAGMLGLIFLFEIIFLPLGFLTGRFYRELKWKSGIWLSIWYLLLVVYILIGTLFQNLEYEGVFWRTFFSPVALFLYLSPAFVACASAYAGSKFSLQSVFFILLTLFLIITGVFYINFRDTAVTTTKTHSFNLLENDEILLPVEIKCERMTQYASMGFKYFSREDCVSKFFVQKKKPVNYSLSTVGYLTIDGDRETLGFSPQIGSDDRFGVDSSIKQNLEETKVWMVTIPWHKILQSKQVNFQWGKINIDFGDAEFKNLRESMEDGK